MEISIEQDLTFEEYKMLRNTTTWATLTDKQIEKLIEHSTFNICRYPSSIIYMPYDSWQLMQPAGANEDTSSNEMMVWVGPDQADEARDDALAELVAADGRADRLQFLGLEAHVGGGELEERSYRDAQADRDGDDREAGDPGDGPRTTALRRLALEPALLLLDQLEEQLSCRDVPATCSSSSEHRQLHQPAASPCPPGTQA